jgi:hypothetical protein
MSYRNPRIIVDRSAEIWAEGITRAGAIIAGSVDTYYKNKQIAEARAAKQRDAYNKLINLTALEYQENLNKAINEKDLDNAIVVDIRKQATNYLEGEDGRDGVIQMKAALNMGGVDPAVAKEYRKRINEYEIWQNNTVNKLADIEVNLDLAENLQGFQLGIKNDFAGQGLEKFKNFIAVNNLQNRQLKGLDVQRSFKNNELSLTTKLNRNSETFKLAVEGGMLNKDDIKFDENGNVTLSWKRDLSKWDGTMIIDTLDNIDSIKALETAGILKDGNVLPSMVKETRIESKVEGNNEIITTKNIIDLDKIENNTVLRAEISGFISGILAGDIDQQINYVNNKLGWSTVETKKWVNSSEQAKRDFLMNNIMDNLEQQVVKGEFPQSEIISKQIGEENGVPIYETYTESVKTRKADKGVSKKDPGTDLSKEIYDGITTNTINYLVGRNYNNKRITDVTPVQGTGNRKFVVTFEVGIGKAAETIIDIDNPSDVERFIDSVSGSYDKIDREKARTYIVEKEEDPFGRFIEKQ